MVDAQIEALELRLRAVLELSVLVPTRSVDVWSMLLTLKKALPLIVVLPHQPVATDSGCTGDCTEAGAAATLATSAACACWCLKSVNLRLQRLNLRSKRSDIVSRGRSLGECRGGSHRGAREQQ